MSAIRSPRSPPSRRRRRKRRCDLIKVEYEPLPFVVDIEDARKPDAPLVFERPVRGESFAGGVPPALELPQQGNVRGPNSRRSRGDVAAGFAAAEVVVEGEFRTQVQTHCCLETARRRRRLAQRTASPSICRRNSPPACARELAQAFGLPLGRVRVVVDAMGGGFGSKSGAGNYVRAAVALSRQARRRRCGSCSTATRNRSTAATVPRRCSACASARAATAR